MTSASGLFYNWRSRAGRDPDQGSDRGLGLDSASPSSDRDPDHRHPRRRARHHLRRADGCGTSHAGPPDPRHSCHRAFHSEHELVASDNSDAIRSRIGNSGNGVIGSSNISRLRYNRNGQLPSAVLQARARLLERLRAVSLTRSRQTTTASDILQDELSIGDDFGVIDSRVWEIDNLGERFESGIIFAELATEANRAPSIQNAYKKPPGLSCETIRTLQQEVFKAAAGHDGLRASLECCICLELFWEGDKLVRLQCGHRFHQSCLEPWVLVCGDCPYCRASI